MDNTREKLIELVNAVLRCLPWGEISSHTAEDVADHLIANGVTVQECKGVEIDQFKSPIDDAILILTEELKQMSDGYTTHLAYGGNGDPAMEENLNALELAISALESQKRMMPQPPKGE